MEWGITAKTELSRLVGIFLLPVRANTDVCVAPLFGELDGVMQEPGTFIAWYPLSRSPRPPLLGRVGQQINLVGVIRAIRPSHELNGTSPPAHELQVALHLFLGRGQV